MTQGIHSPVNCNRKSLSKNKNQSTQEAEDSYFSMKPMKYFLAIIIGFGKLWGTSRLEATWEQYVPRSN